MELKVEDRSLWPLGLMCIISTVALGVSARAILAPSVICVALVCWLWFRAPRLPRPRMFLALLLMVPFALWLREMGAGIEKHYSVPIGFLFIVGLYMMALATHHLMALENGGSTDYALSCSVMGMGMAGTARLAESPNAVPGNPMFLPLLLAFLPLLLLHLRSHQILDRDRRWSRQSWVAYGLAFGVLITCTVVLDRYVVQRIPELNEYVIRKLADSATARRMRVGSGPSGALVRLGDWVPRDGARDNEIALVAFSDERPAEYLRGGAYLTYNAAVWRVQEHGRPLQPDDEEFQGRNVFLLPERPGRADSLDTTIYADGQYANTYFLPMHAHKVATFSQRVHMSEAGTLRPDGRGAAGGYGYFDLSSRLPDPDIERRFEHLQLPSDLVAKLRAIAGRIMGHGRTSQEKINLLRTHFTNNYTYKLGIQLHGGKDPVIEFLEDHDSGHCEYFAASTALLLRAQGIPARYVTGFVMRERGMGGMWLARRRNAHAWVEAWIPNEGWIIVEATPASAQPAVARTTTREQLSEWFDAQWMRAQRVAKYGGIKAMLIMAWDWLMELPQKLPVWVWLILISIGMAWIFRSNLRRMFHRRRERQLSEEAAAIRAMLMTAEKHLKRHGVIRPPAQTVAELLHRVRDSPHIPEAERTQVVRLLSAYQDQRFAPASKADSPVDGPPLDAPPATD